MLNFWTSWTDLCLCQFWVQIFHGLWYMCFFNFPFNKSECAKQSKAIDSNFQRCNDMRVLKSESESESKPESASVDTINFIWFDFNDSHWFFRTSSQTAPNRMKYRHWSKLVRLIYRKRFQLHEKYPGYFSCQVSRSVIIWDWKRAIDRLSPNFS